jgi:FkbM family methyltransferase
MPRLVDGIWRPNEDLHGVNAALEQVGDLDKAIKCCRSRRIAVQAGGNCGIFPQYLSTKFKWVYTFEPEAENFHCLVNNATAHNIIKFQAALGTKDHAPVGLVYDPKNAGGHHVNLGGVIPVISVDSLNLPACDLLQIDIEGFELFALRGAEETIRKNSPVIMIEHKKHATRYGAVPDDVIQFITGLGYIKKQEVRRDLIFIKGET